jgi:hypothetical protein
MWYSVELLENGEIYIQPFQQRIRHGAKGKVLINKCLITTALKIKKENYVWKD